MRLEARVRKGDADTVLREHFEPIPDGDRSHEVRRLLKIAIEYENNQKKLNNLGKDSSQQPH
jgi:hypothetical protein